MNPQREENSSYISSLPIICINLIAAVLFAYFKQGVLATVFMLIFVLGFASYLWAKAACKNLFCDFTYSKTGLFPKETLEETITISNKKLLPVLWLNIYDALTPQFCANSLLWHEEITLTRNWTAEKRGLKKLDDRFIMTGDGFGLRQRYLDENINGVSTIAVYPKRIKVNPKIFMKNLWNANTGKHGTIEDVTVIKTVRDYTPSDAARNINWRLAARNLPLSVNVYETIQPRGVHFIFDGESFSGQPEALEEALSILGSELIELFNAGFESGLSMCRGKDSDAVTITSDSQLEDMLYCLAAYQFEAPKYENDELLEPKSEFQNEEIALLSGSVGHFYYICYDLKAASKSDVLNLLSEESVTVLTFKEGGEQCFENIRLQTLLA